MNKETKLLKLSNFYCIGDKKKKKNEGKTAVKPPARHNMAVGWLTGWLAGWFVAIIKYVVMFLVAKHYSFYFYYYYYYYHYYSA